MSMNKYMHPRNIYKNPPNFKQLAIDYPEFRQHVRQELTGKVILDFKDTNALRALSRTLLKKDFDLEVDIPVNKLIPTIPLRLNYLLWLEDLLNIQQQGTDEIYGIDIGTGASCVYPLIAAKKFKWKMIGTEIDKESIIYAKRNVDQNMLNELIQIHETTGDTLLVDLITSQNRNFDFCMCNPPFFSSTEELHPFFKSRKTTRPHPKNAFCASTNEVVVNGGEVEFISKLIKESEQLRFKIKIFSTMVGHKSSLVPLKALLREIEVGSFKQTEFCQGHTTRWGLAWTYCDIDLRTIPPTLSNVKMKSKPPLSYIIPKSSSGNETLEHVDEKLRSFFKELEFLSNEYKKTKGFIMYDIIAYSNTWSNQRRKRRQKMKCSTTESDILAEQNSIDDKFNSSDETVKTSNSEETNSEVECAFDKFAGLDIASTTPKRELEDDDEYYNTKKFKGSDTVNNNKILVKFFLCLKKLNDSIILELFTTDSTNRESIHQILQYFKNNLK
ncbi:U6 small nuclear RNA (adenine-(43)-N(6))-methyltransferase [Coccinella septempunctata]|uniref:U6 small nuclear RNA (adenine-(43)-N(6))-methyltransferase n=1 Tax=Coccinella septempunctata TaxID=41139 RepID=UPI001D06ECFC|nr:U6 small nuclear RNA (adenine-(43)-N(6))-methyltransferase [Coccinella septempunctata]